METRNNTIISVNDLTKIFDEFVAVDHISFTVKPGEIFAFIALTGRDIRAEESSSMERMRVRRRIIGRPSR